MNKLIVAAMLSLGGAAFSCFAHGTHQHTQARADAEVSSTLKVSGCWIRSLPAPAPSAGYFIIENSGKTDAKLQSAASATYGMVMLHQTTHKDGMSRMSETHDVAIPAQGRLEFKPGGYHAMLEQPHVAPAIGSQVAIDFFFDTGEKATAQCEVKPANTQAH